LLALHESHNFRAFRLRQQNQQVGLHENRERKGDRKWQSLDMRE
jgi:hypothetical protein